MNTLGQTRDLSALCTPSYTLVTYCKQQSDEESPSFVATDNDLGKLARQGKAQLKGFPQGSRAECVDMKTGRVVNSIWS